MHARAPNPAQPPQAAPVGVFMFVKQYYRKARLTERDRLLRRLEFLQDADFPADEPEIEAILEILGTKRGVGAYVPPPAALFPQEPLWCPACGAEHPCYVDECLHPLRRAERGSKT